VVTVVTVVIVVTVRVLFNVFLSDLFSDVHLDDRFSACVVMTYASLFVHQQ
jgi:hypothetical protein